ncbi:MAG: hypothetical protein OQK57_06420 [Ignavibacteriaceae bacterium]|nr:hypothetical protein [Ignavibacteriaceae bacterium]
MEKKKAIELIKLEVLYCLNESDSEALRISKEVDADFPWKELGEYQNLAALLPAALTLEFPVSELKDKVALKLYNMRDEIKAKLDAKKALEKPPAPIVEEEEIVIDEEINVDDIDVSIQEEDSARVDSVAEKIQHKRMAEELAVKTDLRSKVTIDKELVEKTVKEYLKSHFEPELKSIRKEIKRNFIISLALFVISLILIVTIFLMG